MYFKIHKYTSVYIRKLKYTSATNTTNSYKADFSLMVPILSRSRLSSVMEPSLAIHIELNCQISEHRGILS